MKEERTIIIKENENAEEVEAYEEKIIKLLAEILMEIPEYIKTIEFVLDKFNSFAIYSIV